METGDTMSSNSGNSFWGRIQSWWKGLSGTPSEATTVDGTNGAPASDTGQELQAAQPSAGDATGPASASVQERVSDINAGMREQAGKMARPLDDPGGTPQATTGASTDEFSSGGYTPETTAPGEVASAADAAVAPEPADVAEDANVGIPPSPAAGEPDAGSVASAGTGVVADRSDATEDVGSPAEDSTYASKVDDVTSGQDAAERTDSGPADAYQPVDPEAVTSDESPVYDEGTAGSGTIRPAASAALEGEPPAGGADASSGDDVGGGTYAATAGDIAAAGPSTGTDLGIDSSADLDASELGSLEDSEDTGSVDVTAATTTVAGARFGDRQGADLSRTGLYADVRGDGDTASFDDPGTSPRTGVAGPAGTPIEQSVAGGATSEAQEGAGNLDATAGDDYSAARSAEMTSVGSPESTTTSAIGEEMASGEEADDLVGEPPRDTPAPGVAVDMDAETTPEASGTYAGAVRGDGTANTPPGYPIKGKGTSMVYHTPEMPSYRDTMPDWCFATVDDAIAAGFRAPRPRNLAGTAGPAATAPAGSGGDTGSDADDIESLQMPSPDDTAAGADAAPDVNSDDNRTA